MGTNSTKRPQQPFVTLYYTTTDSQKLKLYDKNLCNSEVEQDRAKCLVSHTYENGVGTMVVDADLFSNSPRTDELWWALDLFVRCDTLETLTLSNDIEMIPPGFCEDCTSLKRVELPENLECICSEAFVGCSSLESIQLPERVKFMGDCVFGASGLKSIHIPERISYEHNKYFFSSLRLCSNMESVSGNYVSEDGRSLISEDKLIGVILKGDKTYVVPSNIKVIGEDVFADTDLESVEIPLGVEEIEHRAFARCKSLRRIVIPESVKKVAYTVFEGCTGLECIEIKSTGEEVNRRLPRSGYLSSLREIISPYAAPDGRSVVINGELEYAACAGLTEYRVPDGVVSLAAASIDGCRELTHIDVNEVYEICVGCIVDCPSLASFSGACASQDGRCLLSEGDNLIVVAPAGLTEYRVPDGVVFINTDAFRKCVDLEKITLPRSVKYVYYGAFYMCKKLRYVQFEGQDEPLELTYDDEFRIPQANVYVDDDEQPSHKRRNSAIPQGVKWYFTFGYLDEGEENNEENSEELSEEPSYVFSEKPRRGFIE